jgi:hypothetical protein
MSQHTNSGAAESGGVMSRVRTPILFLLGVVLVLGAYYFLYAQKKTSYLVGRNFRLLATMGSMVREAIQSHGELLKSEGGVDEIRGMTKFPCVPSAAEVKALGDSESPLFRFQGTDFELAGVDGDNKTRPFCYKLDTAKIFPALFDSQGAFDGVLLARQNGEVIYRHGVADLGITQLAPLLAPAKPKEDKAAAAGAASSYTSAASYRNVELGGREYKLFLQPISLPVDSSFATGAHTTWLLCGVVAADEFVYKSLAISSSLLLAILAPLLLAVLAWPLIRLRLIGERQRIRVFDVLLLGLCSLFGVAVLTLTLLDVHAYAELRSVSEAQLRLFADQMARRIPEEIQVARGDLADLQKLAIDSGYRAGEVVSESKVWPGNPAWNRFALVDKNGRQMLRWRQQKTHRKGPQRFKGDRTPRPSNVDDRQYFKRVLDGEMWTVPGRFRGEELGPFFVESLRGRSSNRREAALAVPAVPLLEAEGLEVATLTIPMRSVIDPIAPSGFEFAVIDNEGAVLFHSNSHRNGVENFFTETDGDRRLRSAVFARRGAEMNIRYFGKDYMAVVQPVQALPWTVVALRDTEQLQTLNMEWVVTTVLFLLLCSSPFAAALLGAVVLRPAYRAPWLWPDPERAGEYLSLAALLAVYCLVFGAAIQVLPGAGQRLGIAWGLPFLAALTCYVRLREPARQRRRRRWAEKLHLPVARTYPLAALLLVVLTTVLPTWSLFKAVHGLELHSFIRHGQLALARGLSEPAKSGAGRTIEKVNSEPEFGYYGSSFFATQILATEREACPCEHGPAAGRTAQPDAAQVETSLPEVFADLLPHYSAHSAEMRELLHDRASDCSWDSHRRLGDALDLHLRGNGGAEVHLTSGFPGLFTGGAQKIATAGFLGGRSGGSLIAGGALRLGVVLLFLLVLVRLVLFISQRLFLIDVREPLWTVAGDLPAPIAGRNLFLVRQGPISPAEAAAMGLEHLDLREIEQASGVAGPAGPDNADSDAWAVRCRELVESGGGVLLTGFEHRICDPACNARKLALLESLMELRERTIVVLSQVSPARLFSCRPAEAAASGLAGPAGGQGLHDRWRTVLDAFTVVEEDLRSRPAAGRAAGRSFWSELLEPLLRRRGLADAAPESSTIRSPVLREESGRDPFLIRIAQGMDPGSHGMGREQLLEELGERAEGYYGAVWDSCSRDEKVVLQHLAQEGLVHEKNRRVVRRLMARGLIRRGPNFCLLNESFRRFACSALCRSEVLALEQSAAPSSWDRFRWPFLAALSASLAFFFATQQQLLDSTLAVVTGLTAGLPAVVKIIDLLGGKRSGGAK